jgi:hypothetical protein
MEQKPKRIKMTNAKAPKAVEVKDTLSAFQVTLRKGIYTARKGFFYTNGYTAENFVAKVLKHYPEAQILDSGEIWTPFIGDAPVARQSHWFVKFTLEGRVGITIRAEERVIRAAVFTRCVRAHHQYYNNGNGRCTYCDGSEIAGVHRG